MAKPCLNIPEPTKTTALCVSEIEIVPISPDPRFQDLTGEDFSYLHVLGYAGRKKNSQHMWWAQCCCEDIRVYYGSNLKSSKSQSCGCMRASTISKKKKSHGMTETSEYNIYRGMVQRCSDKNTPAYQHYGAQGVEVEFSSFEDFFEYMGPRPSDDYSVDRIDPHGNYAKGNVRWATIDVQADNKRNTHYITIDGVTKTRNQWAKIHGLSCKRTHARLAAGWCEACAVTIKPSPGEPNICPHMERPKYTKQTPFLTIDGVTKSQEEWGAPFGVPSALITKRTRYQKWCVDCSISIAPGKGVCPHTKSRP